MYDGKRVLAIVPARSGSKGIPDKNMREIGGVSLIGWAGRVLLEVPFLDARVITTDSARYAREGERYGLRAPFLRPAELSHDAAGAVETLQHALVAVEQQYQTFYDVILVIEPTSPLRTSSDIVRVTRRLLKSRADSVVTVSPLNSKFFPQKILTRGEDRRVGYFVPEGSLITGRQQLEGEYYWRNGVCYALTRACLMDRESVITESTLADVIDRPLANVDDPIDLEWAEFLMQRARMLTAATRA